MRQIALEISFSILFLTQSTVFAATVSNTSSPQASGQKYFEQAQILLRKGDYKQAEIELRCSISERSNVALSHYYLANTLVRLQRHEEAIEEFKRSYKLDPYGLTSGYCRKALVTYGQKSPTDESPIATDGELDAVAAIKHYNKSPKGEIKPDSARVAAIKNQAEREKLRHQEFADSLVKSANLIGDVEAREIRNRAKEDVDNIINGAQSLIPARQMLQAERATAIRKNAEEMEIIVRDRAAKRSQQYSQWSKEKGELLDETVSNIQNQLYTKSLPGTPKLNEIGTDLFVRNYGQSSTSASVGGARPAVVKVNSDNNSSSGNNPANATVGDNENAAKQPGGLRATPALQNSRLPITSRTVHGQIVPPM
jgi:tetratricopeptide (TPR) repeat protein